MDNTFTRALLGFSALTLGLIGMTMVALWAITNYTEGVWWASLVVIVMGLVSQIGVYASTLHDPIYRWIRALEAKQDYDTNASMIRRIVKGEIEVHENEHHEVPLTSVG